MPAGETLTETYHRLKGLNAARAEEQRPDGRGNHLGAAAAGVSCRHQDLGERRGAPQWALRDNHTRDNHCTIDVLRRNFEGNRGEQDKGHTAQTWTKTLVCFHCQQPGHKAQCPLNRPKITGLCYVPRKNEQGDNHDSGEKSRTVQVKVNGKSLTALLHSGSSISLDRKQCVPCAVDYSQ